MSESLRDKLIAAEPEDPVLRGEYERRVQAMLEMPLNVPRKIGFSFAVIASAGTAILAGVLAVKMRSGPPLLVGELVIGGVLAAVAAILAGRVLARGTLHRDRDTNAMAGLIWAFVVVMSTGFLLLFGIDTIRGVGMIGVGLLFLVGAGVMLLRTTIERSELHTREKLLEMELRIARISEELGKLRPDR